MTYKEIIQEDFERELALFTDKNEGLAYYNPKKELQNKQSGMWWSAIAYVERMPKDMLNRLKDLGYQVAISPLHDKDQWEHNSPPKIDEETGEVLVPEGYYYKVGDKKKSHYHIIVKLNTRMSYKDVNILIKRCTHGPDIQQCLSIKEAYADLTRFTYQNGYTYDKNKIITFNKFTVNINSIERKILLAEIVEYVLEQEIDTWDKLVKHYLLNYEMINIISKNAYFLEQLIDENWKFHHLDECEKYKIIKHNPDDEEIYEIIKV